MLRTVFYALIATFMVIIGQFFIPAIGDLFRGSFLFLLPFAVFFLLGAALIFLTLKKKVKGKLKKFLILTGASSAGFFVSVLLHNLLYGLAIIASQITFLKYLLEALHVAFFFIATIVCPLGFLIGATGSLALFVRKKRVGK